MSRADLTVVPDLERELDELYGRPLEEFTGARNDLAKRLKKAGQKAEAERVAALRKPPLPVWAINQLARSEADGVQKLLAAGEELREAQQEALGGKGTERFEEAGKRQRDAIRALVPRAVKLLSDAGNRPGAAAEERIASSLRAASVDPEAARLLERGRLEEEVESSGLDLLAGLVPAGGARTAAPSRRKGPSRTEAIREAREALKEARETERERRKEAAAAEREAKAAAAAAEEAAERARELAAEADRAGEAVEEAEAELERLRGSK